MAVKTKRNMFNEATRVQMPAMVHLTRIGYSYFGKITESMAETVYDPDTNILLEVFKKQFEKLNPDYVGDSFVNALKQIGEDISFENRSRIARLNGINNYVGSATQNLELLQLLKDGRLIS